MPAPILWQNFSGQTVNWAQVIGPNLSQGPLANGQKYTGDSTNVDFAGFSGLGASAVVLSTLNLPPGSNYSAVLYASNTSSSQKEVVAHLKALTKAKPAKSAKKPAAKKAPKAK